jgi:hypothetical protein
MLENALAMEPGYIQGAITPLLALEGMGVAWRAIWTTARSHSQA